MKEIAGSIILLIAMFAAAFFIRAHYDQIDHCWFAKDPFICQEMRDAIQQRGRP